MRKVRINPMVTIALAFAIATALAACDVPSAQGAPPPRDVALMSVADCAAGSLCFSSRWTAVSDSAGAADHYRVRIVTSGVTPGISIDTTVTATSFAFRLACSPGASGSITADVWSVRRGQPSAVSKRATAGYTCPDPAPPAPDSVIIAPDSTGAGGNPNPPAGETGGVDSLPLAALFVEPRPESPHFDHIFPTITDFCYCWDGVKGDSARAWAARHFDFSMSGNLAAWHALNPTMQLGRYTLMQTTFTEEPDTTGFSDNDNITGKWQYDARTWFTQHPEYDYESMWLHDTTAGTPADSAHRLRRLIWKNYRYAINPLDPGARAYTIDRMKRVRADIPVATGIFIDEADGSALGWIRWAREGAGMDSLVWQDSVVSLVRAIRDSLAPATVQTNAAAYSPRRFERAVGVAAGSMHLEQMNKVTQEMPSVWTFVDGLLADSVMVDLINLETFTDFLRPALVASYPPGNYGLGVYRAMVVQLVSYYMVVPRDVRRLGFHVVGAKGGITPDSVWLPIYQLDVGHPVGPRRLVLDVRDAVNQRARVYRRDFTNAVVLTRPVAYWADTNLRDTTAVPVPLPEGGPWSMVMARGDLVPLDSLRLRNSEAVILVRRP